MTLKTLKPLVAMAAVSVALATPAAAQIAKFHMIAPAMPGLVKLDRTASPGSSVADFVGNTNEMNQEKAASLGQARESEDVVGRDGQEIDDETGGGNDDVADRGNTDPGGDGANDNITPPAPRPEIVASAAPEGLQPRAEQPTTGRQVIVRTRTKGPRGGSKIKSGTVWSVGEFR